MRRRVIDAAREQLATQEEGDEEASASKDRAVFLQFNRGQMLHKLQKSSRALVENTHELDDPKRLPDKAEAQRWWPEPARPRSARVLVSPRDPSPRARAVATGQRRIGSARIISRPRGVEAPGASLVFLAGAGRQPGGRGRPPSKLAPEPDTDGHADGAFNNHAAVLSSWMDAYTEGEEEFASKAVFVEMRLRQALACSARLGAPNGFRAAIVCDAWERIAPLTGRYQATPITARPSPPLAS